MPRTISVIALVLLTGNTQAIAEPRWVAIAAGDYQPLFVSEPPNSKSPALPQPETRNSNLDGKVPGSSLVHVNQFQIQRDPVSNGDFLKFVIENPEWMKGRIKGIFSDKMYLYHWSGQRSVGSAEIQSQPVVYISWFAARAYCKWTGARLPTSDEWEYVVSKDDANKRDQIILDWYSKPNDLQRDFSDSKYIGTLGVRDMVGKVWEWTGDFNSSLVTGDSREDDSLSRSMFCGAGSIGAADPSAYATFMRLAFRSSLKGNYALPILGFRCAKES
ncbi:MAG: formylglycine-generating enzyme family protein [Oligoflexales bacterium]